MIEKIVNFVNRSPALIAKYMASGSGSRSRPTGRIRIRGTFSAIAGRLVLFMRVTVKYSIVCLQNELLYVFLLIC